MTSDNSYFLCAPAPGPSCCDALNGIQLFRERLSEKAHATVPKGIVGGFEFSVLQRNLKELARKAIEMYFEC